MVESRINGDAGDLDDRAAHEVTDGPIHDPANDAAPPESAGGSEAAEAEMPVTELVHRLHEGEITAAQLPLAVRRQCVDHLTLEGFTTSEIAELMRTSERTIRRDREAERHAGAMQPSAELGDELLGEFERVMQASTQRLARLARDPETPAYARLWAEEAIVRNYQRFIQTAHRLHYLEEGGRRLAKQRAADPANRNPIHEHLEAQMKRLLGISS